MSGLRIAPGLELPVDVAGESTAILAKKGAGKSNTAKVIVEETLDHGGIQVVVLDPIGHWWSLRAGADGKQKGGYPVAVFGGMHGDLPLEETAGKLLAQTAVESGQSLVLDVSSLESNGAMQRFVYELLEELYRLKQASPSPLLLVLEEADEFAPQDPKGKNVPRMVGAANRISKRGRGRGIGMLYVTQRSAALNKNVLDQADTLIVMRTIGPRDRAAIEGWVKHQDAQGMDEILPSLPSLATGEAWVWTPERQLLERVQIRKARTYDSSWTPRAGDAKVIVDVKPIDVDQLGHAIAATVERVKASDPEQLRKRVRELERDLAASATVKTVFAEPVIEERIVEVEVPVSAITRAHLEPTRHRLLDMRAALEEGLRDLEVLGDELDTFPTRLIERPRVEPGGGPAAHRASARRPVASSGSNSPAPTRPALPAADRPTADDGISGPQQRILNALAALEQIGVPAAAKVQVALFAEASPKSSSYSNNLGTLRAGGLIDYPSGGRVQLTDAGRAIADAGGAPQTVDELHRFVASLVGGAKWRILEALVAAYPDALSKQELADRAGASSSSSSFSNNLGSLRSLGLIDYPQGGYVAALPVLFMEGA